MFENAFRLPPKQRMLLGMIEDADRTTLKHIFVSLDAPRLETMAGEFQGRLLNQGARLTSRLIHYVFASRGTWTGKAFHPTSVQTGFGYNCFEDDGQAYVQLPMRITIGPSMLDQKPALIIDYRDCNRGPICWLDGEVRRLSENLLLGEGIFAPRFVPNRAKHSRKIPFIMIGPIRRFLRRDIPVLHHPRGTVPAQCMPVPRIDPSEESSPKVA